MPGCDQDIVPPPNIRWLIELVGEDAALRLVERYGGVRIEVPKKITETSEIVRSTGLAPATLAPLAAHHGAERITLPICREWRVRIYRLRERQSYAQIARRLGMVENTVWRILNNSGMTQQQMDLFQ